MSLRNTLLCRLSLIMLVGGFALRAAGRPADGPSLKVKSTSDFEVTGDGSNPAWEKTGWTPLHKRSSQGHSYEARFKVLYSKKGIYFLMDGTDSKLTASFTQDFEDLWTEDVYEVFLWTDERDSIYFEYEISPLNYELPILVPNFGGEFLGWRPWHYDGERKIRKATAVRGGPRKSGASIQGMERRVLHSLRGAAPSSKRSPETRHALAGELLPRRPRRREEDRLDVVQGGRAVSRVRTVRNTRVQRVDHRPRVLPE